MQTPESQTHVHQDANTWTQAHEMCDLVMKGGVTSGVIYPKAVLALARRYRFRNIGGTSAGAIAAAVTAAAEYGRDQHAGGFGLLAGDVVARLTTPGFIRDLFQTSDETQPLLDGLLTFRRRQRARQVSAAQTRASDARSGTSTAATAWDVLATLWEMFDGAPKGQLQRAGLVGIGVGIAVMVVLLVAAWLAHQLLASALLVVFAVVALVLGWLIGVVYGLWTLLTVYVPQHHGYGICTGGGPDPRALTNWLATTIDALAGQPEAAPLTFRQLAQNHQPQIDPETAITLNIVTTNLSQNQPYTLPFTSGPFLFSAQEFRALFPDYVVDAMIAHAQQHWPQDIAQSITIDVATDQDRAITGHTHELYFLPRGLDLPVVVATRMSLSFPLLISAVPLWTINSACLRKQRDEATPITLVADDFQRNWFSDGGICSNFPIHLFDSWFPRKPTFGINLEELPDELFVKDRDGHATAIKPEVQAYRSINRPDPAGASEPWRVFEELPFARPIGDELLVQMPTSSPHQRPMLRWDALDGKLGSFLGSIINTGLFYHDALQARLPSYYDRIVTIYHSENEGGMNLDMEEAVITDIAKRGTNAGEEVLERFQFALHRWVRLRLLLAEMEEQIVKLRLSVLPPTGASANGAPCSTPPTSLGRLDWHDESVQQALKLLQDAITRSGLDANEVKYLIECQFQANAERPDLFPYPADLSWRDPASPIAPRFLLLQLLIELWAQPDAQGQEQRVFRDPNAPPRNGMSMRVTPDV